MKSVCFGLSENVSEIEMRNNLSTGDVDFLVSQELFGFSFETIGRLVIQYPLLVVGLFWRTGYNFHASLQKKRPWMVSKVDFSQVLPEFLLRFLKEKLHESSRDFFLNTFKILLLQTFF